MPLHDALNETTGVVGAIFGVNYGAYLKALLAIVVAVVVAFLLRKLVVATLSGRLPRHILTPLARVVYYVVIFLGIIGALAALGIETSGLLLAGGIAGIVIGFASQTVVSNLLSGIFLYMDRPFMIGDPVDIDGVGGVVQDITIFSTRIRRWDGVVMRIPNEQVFNSKIQRFNGSLVRRVEYRVGISYGSDISKAINVIMKLLESEPLVLVKPEPMVFVEDLGDSAVILNVRFWVPSQYWFPVKASVLGKIKEALASNGIEIPFPQRVVWFANKLETASSPQDSEGS
ncbi:MAG: mechanosensitive ion channel family protein [Desulfurococcales archaeon]|nr:mechanosensitive ion channel family protein [Desulfurococcales archaeon]